MSFVQIGWPLVGVKTMWSTIAGPGSFILSLKFRDFDFWDTHDVKEKLKEALTFMSGDRAYHFTFQPGHSTPPA